MKLTITSIRLKSPFKFFPLSLYAMRILNQLKMADSKGFKKQGVWTLHYTMTLWASETDLQNFTKSGAHLEAMKKSKRIASEIATLTIDAEELMDWPEAKRLLQEEGKVVRFS